MQVTSANIINYNANTRGTNTGDCTARAISLAFNIDYRVARKALNDSAKSNWQWNYNTDSNVWKVIRELGGGEIVRTPADSPITVNDFADEHNQATYIIWCTKHETGHEGSHLVTIINGSVYDSWDSRGYFVRGYWEIKSGVHVEDITDIQEALKVFFKSRDINQYGDYLDDVLKGIIDKNRKLKKLAEDYDLEIKFGSNLRKIEYTTYSITFTYKVSVVIAKPETPTEPIYADSYTNKLHIAFKPTMTSEEIQPYFDKVFYSKSYDFMHTVVDKVADVCDGEYLLHSYGQEVPEKHDLDFSWDKKSEKSFNRLPYWVRRLATYFRVDYGREGSYYDSVELTIQTPPFDTLYGKATETSSDVNHRRFHAYNVSDLKRGLDYYRNTGDYEHAYEIAADY